MSVCLFKLNLVLCGCDGRGFAIFQNLMVSLNGCWLAKNNYSYVNPVYFRTSFVIPGAKTLYETKTDIGTNQIQLSAFFFRFFIKGTMKKSQKLSYSVLTF